MTLGPKRLTFPSGLVNIEACVTIGANSFEAEYFRNLPRASHGIAAPKSIFPNEKACDCKYFQFQ